MNKNNNVIPQNKAFRTGTEELVLQLQWMGGLQEQIEFANSQVLSDFWMELKIVLLPNTFRSLQLEGQNTWS